MTNEVPSIGPSILNNQTISKSVMSGLVSSVKLVAEDYDLWTLLQTIISYGAQTAMVIGGVAPFVPQFLSIKKAGSNRGFSLYVCLALLVANTLRILFW